MMIDGEEDFLAFVNQIVIQLAHQGVANIRIFKYFPVRIFVCIIFVSFFEANIFRYSFVLFF